MFISLDIKLLINEELCLNELGIIVDTRVDAPAIVELL